MTPRVIVIGPPGAGKSSVGGSLARKLRVEFHDTDHLIEAKAKKKVAQIFIDDGEAAFRALEEEVCARALEQESGVLSLGGGAILSALTRERIQATGALTVYLDVTLKVAAPRIGFNRDRPLLLQNPRQQWQNLMDQRRPLYEELATITCIVGDRSVNDIVEELLPKVAVS